MSIVLIATPVLAAVALLSFGSWTGRYFESSLWPTLLDEGR